MDEHGVWHYNTPSLLILFWLLALSIEDMQKINPFFLTDEFRLGTYRQP